MKIPHYVIISPCFNEESVIGKFLENIESNLDGLGISITVVVVDDCSIDGTLDVLKGFRFKNGDFELVVVSLNYNHGHQQAIAQGLRYASEIPAKGYIVMDSDGEDDPAAIKELVKLDENDIVFVTRGKRKEKLSFKIGYLLYRLLFKIVCGKAINFGNYTKISPKVINALKHQRFIHYSAFLSKLKFNKHFVQYDRLKRIDGLSKMNMNGLVLHGLKSLIEYSEELLFFFFRMMIGLIFIILCLGFFVAYVKIFTDEAVMGWASTLGIGLMNSILIIGGVVIISLILLSLKENIRPQSSQYTVIKRD